MKGRPGVSYVIPISLRSFSVRVRNIRRSMSCSSSKERYLEKPICSKNSARSYRNRRCYGWSRRQQYRRNWAESHTHTVRGHTTSESKQTQTCLRATVGGRKTGMCPHPTVHRTTGVSCIIASKATLAFWMMALTDSARAALFALVRVLVGRDALCHCKNRNQMWRVAQAEGFPRSPHYSPQNLPSWGQSHEAGLRCCCCCSSWWACRCQRMDCHLWSDHIMTFFGRCQRALLIIRTHLHPFQPCHNTGVLLTSAAVALAVQLIDGGSHVTVADALFLFTKITERGVAWWHCIRFCKQNSSDPESQQLNAFLLNKTIFA